MSKRSTVAIWLESQSPKGRILTGFAGILAATLLSCTAPLVNPPNTATPTLVPIPSELGSTYAFVETQVFDGAQMHVGWTVLVRDGLIAEAGESSAVTVPSGIPVLQAAGYTLLPGLIEGHGHLEFYDPAVVLQGGITTFRDLGWPAERIFPLAESLATPSTSGPALLPAGPMLTAVGGYPSTAFWAPDGTALEVGSTEEARTAVASLATRGARHIKVAQQPGGPLLSREQLLAIVDEAHRRGLRVSSHVGSLEQLQLAADVGIDELAHGLWSSETVPDSLLDTLVQKKIAWIPTLHCAPDQTRLDNTRRFVARGGTVLYGTDMGNSGPPPGIDVDELKLMVTSGLTPAQALASATGKAAAVYGLTDRGRIAPGLRADLVWTSGDPTVDLTVLALPALVIRQGIQVPRKN